jgi:succinoglycan biosynthesis transport protein ExoP
MSIEIGKLEIKGIIRRRKKVAMICFGLIFFICLVVAFLLPPVYQSTTMIVVENQDIPAEYVKSTMTTFISERLHVLTEKILSYAKLLEIARAHDLYPDLTSPGEMVNQMREDIKLKSIDVALKESGGRERATIAFTLSYNHKSAEKAKAIVDMLAAFYVQEDQKTREAQAGKTTQFLEKELEELRRQVRLNEEKISRFKASNINQLPGSTSIFSQTIFRLEQDIDSIDTRIRTIQEKIVYLKSQIVNIDPMIPILTEEGKVANNPANRLKYLRLQLIRLQANLSDKHPDIIRMKSEIDELEEQVGDKDTTVEKINRLKIVETQIAKLKSRYGDKHPDLVGLSREAELLKRQIAAARTRATSEEEQTDNPGYMNIRAQIITAESEIEALRAERIKLDARLTDYQQRLERMPFIDEEYNSLTLDFANTKQKFNEVANKLHSARISQEMDLSEQGARFRIDSPGNLPHRPAKPNRLMIILMGFILGIGGSIVLAALAEGLDASVKAADELESIAGVPVLAALSFVELPSHKRMRRLKQMMVVAVTVGFILIASLAINQFIMPIGDLWAKFEDRLVEMGVPIEKEYKN